MIAAAWLHHTVAVASTMSFMLFSSVVAVFGNVGQAAYSGANAYLDSLASCRVSQGVVALGLQLPLVFSSTPHALA